MHSLTGLCSGRGPCAFPDGIVLGPGALRIPLRDCARPGGCAFPGRSPRGPCNLEWHPGPAARWYAVGFEGLVDYISANLPVNEEIGKALGKEIPMYPPIAIREFVANALIHQDFSIGGSSPMIEIFANRMEITNPGKPLIDVFRFIDHTPISRNEKLASLMRRMNICEERGSGVDRALLQCEIAQLPAPDFQKDELFTKVIMFAPMTLRQMNKEDKRRACYQHCCLQYLSGQKMTNESFRGRLNISDENYSMASRIIADTIRAKSIKPDDSAPSKKFAKYVPNGHKVYVTVM